MHELQNKDFWGEFCRNHWERAVMQSFSKLVHLTSVSMLSICSKPEGQELEDHQKPLIKAKPFLEQTQFFSQRVKEHTQNCIWSSFQSEESWEKKPLKSCEPCTYQSYEDTQNQLCSSENKSKLHTFTGNSEISPKLWTGQHINHNSCHCCALSHTVSWKRQATQSSEIQEKELIK